MEVFKRHTWTRYVYALCLSAVIIGASAGNGLPVAAEEEPGGFDRREYWLKDPYGVEKSWEVSRGRGVKIAILDSGVDGSHPDLKGVVVAGKDFSGVGSPDGQKPVGPKMLSHGTWVASLAAARPHDGGGMAGAAPEAEIMSASLWVGNGNPGGVPFDEQITEAIFWAVDNGAGIINMSLGRDKVDWPQSWDAAFRYAEQNDVLVIAAAGNRENGRDFVGAPATIPGVLTVGGLDVTGKASMGSSVQGVTIGVMAPAEGLLGANLEGEVDLWDGTSGAAPIVAGIAANIRSKYPEMKAPEIINRIISTTRSVNGKGSKTSVDPIYGRGVVDAYAAIKSSVPSVAENPLGTIEEWIRVNRRAETEGKSLDEADSLIQGETVAEPPALVARPPWEKTFPLALVVTSSGVLLIVCVTAAGLIHVIFRIRRMSFVGGWGADGIFLLGEYDKDLRGPGYSNDEHKLGLASGESSRTRRR